MSVKKIGIIGAGSSGRAHASAVKRMPNAELIGIHDINHDHLGSITQEFACRPYDRSDDLIADADGVIVAVPNNAHFKYAMKALAQGKNVLCEKPMAISVKEAQTMCDRVTQDMAAVVGFNYRFLPAVDSIKQALQNGQLGEVEKVSLYFKKNSAFARPTYSWRDGPGQNLTSGSLGDLGSHLIDLVHYFFKEEIDAKHLRVRSGTRVPVKENRPVCIDDYAIIRGSLANDIPFELETSKSSPGNETGMQIDIRGEQQSVVFNSNQGGMIRRFIAKDNSWKIQKISPKPSLPDPPREVYGWADSFKLQLGEWLEHMDAPQEPCRAATFQNGLSVQRVLNSIPVHPAQECQVS